MSRRLPEKGDMRSAAKAITARVAAITGGQDFAWSGPATIDLASGEASHDDVLARAYGDLLLVGEVIRDGGLMLVQDTIVHIAFGEDAQERLLALMLESVAIGVLMERQRWERGS